MRIIRAILGTSGVALLTASCGDGATNPDLDLLGSGSVQITGSVTQSFTGPAVFGTDILGEQIFGVAIENLEGTGELTIAVRGGRPSSGTFPLGGAFSAAYAEIALRPPGGQPQYYISTGGTLQVSSSSSDKVEGTISFQARREFGGAGQINVAASFRARCFPTLATTCD